MDLLLHLIRVHEIDIFDIDILKLSKEYLQYLRLLNFDDLADAGSFIEMAATLIEIKSRMLLPQDENKMSSEDGEDEDPVQALQQRLIQYETIRKAAAALALRPQVGVEIQTNWEWRRLESVFEGVEAPLKGDAAMLVVLYEQMLQSLGDRKVTRVEARRHLVSLEETIENMAKEVEVLKFALFQGFYNRFQSRYELVVNILAVLELARQFKMKFYQQDLMGPLWVYQPECRESDLPFHQQSVAIPMEMDANHLAVISGEMVVEA